jgi:hypothetical protein
MVLLALAVLAASALMLWLCLPTREGTVQPFLREPLETIAAAAITAGVGIGTVLLIGSIAQQDW